MKKRLSILIVLSISILLIIPVSAVENPDNKQTVIVEDEETPQAGAKKNNTIVYVSGLFIIATVIMISNYQMNIKIKPCKLAVRTITNNGDGSYTIMCSITNPNRKEVNIKSNNLRIINGSTIILQNTMSKNIKAKDKEDCLIAVINEDSKIEWQVDNKKMIIDAKRIIEKGESYEI